LSSIFKNSLGSLLSRSPMRPTHHYSSSDTLHAASSTSSLPAPQYTGVASSSQIMITRQQSSQAAASAAAAAAAAPASVCVDQKLLPHLLQTRSKRADSIRSTLVPAPVPQSVPAMVRQASAPAIRQQYMQVDRVYGVDDAVRESDEDTDEDIGIAAMVTKMATPEQPLPAVVKEEADDATDNETDTAEEMQVEMPGGRVAGDHQQAEGDQKPKEEEEEELLQEEDVSMVDCSSSIVNAETMSFVSCSETFASSAYETVPSREESICGNEQEDKAEAALRLSLRLSADATSFANFRLSTLFAREPGHMGAVAEVCESGEAASDAPADRPREDQPEEQEEKQGEEQRRETGQQDDASQQQMPAGTADKMGSAGEEDNENPIHARLRSLRSRRLNKPAAETTAETTAAAAAAESASGRRFRATQTAARPESGSSKKKPITKMGPLQLDRLTKLNTRRNSTYMTCRIERYTVSKEGSRPPSPSLLMQLRAQERREALGIDHYCSIYSSSSECDSEETSDDEDAAEYGLPNGEVSLEDLVFETRPLTPLLISSEDEGDDEEAPLQQQQQLVCVEAAGSSEIKRKSVELSAPLHPSTSGNSG
ncbi:hypothetical protein LPJ75_004646, partial [Coemansia sp. RSA 2598]